MMHWKGHRPNFKKCVSFDLAIPFLGISYTETLIYTHRDLCTRILMQLYWKQMSILLNVLKSVKRMGESSLCVATRREF